MAQVLTQNAYNAEDWRNAPHSTGVSASFSELWIVLNMFTFH